MKLNNKGVATTAIIIILTILLVASLGYIGYDKFIAKDDKNNDTTVETVGYEEVKKLYDSLVYGDDYGKGYELHYGLYFKEKVDSSNVMPFVTLALKNYVKEKDIKIKYFSYGESGSLEPVGIATGDGDTTLFSEMTEQDGKIAKETIINYIKEKYGVEVTKDQITDGDWHSGTTRIKDLDDYIVIASIPAGGSEVSIYTNMTNYEQQGKDLIIYDNAIIAISGEGPMNFFQYINFANNDDCVKYYESTGDGTIVDDKGNKIEDYEFSSTITKFVNDSLKDGTAGSYKHTFTLGSDNTYHWISSEKIN